MPITKDYDAIEKFYARILLYGPSQSGKTTFIGTMPEDRDDHRGRFIINLEGKNLLPLHMAGRKFEWEDVTSYERLLKVIVNLRARFDRGDSDVPKTVALDGGGACYACIMKYIITNAKVEQPQIQHYFTAQQRLVSIIEEIHALPCHTVITFHDMIDKDETTGEILGNIALPGKYLPSDVLKKFNMVFHTEVDISKEKTGVYRLCTKRTKRYPAGDKTGVLEYHVEPDFNIIYNKVVKKLEELKGKK